MSVLVKSFVSRNVGGYAVAALALLMADARTTNRCERSRTYSISTTAERNKPGWSDADPEGADQRDARDCAARTQLVVHRVVAGRGPTLLDGVDLKLGM